MRSLISLVFVGGMLAGSAQSAQLNGYDLGAFPTTPAERKEGWSGPVLTHEVPNEALILAGERKRIKREAVKSGISFSQYLSSQNIWHIADIDEELILVCGPSRELLEKGWSVVFIPPEYKYSRSLVQNLNSTQSDKELAFIVYHSGDQLSVVETIQRKGYLTQSPVDGRVGFKLSGDDRLDVVKEIASLPQVYSIQLAGGAKLFNANGRRIVQSSTTDAGGETLWQRGLYGEGQVIAVLDTGADPLSCYLAEQEGVLPPLVNGTELVAGEMTRRKIIAYDLLDCPENEGTSLAIYDGQGHGTSVCGNVAASKLDDEFSTEDDIYNGVAPAAKLVVQDAGHQTDDCADLTALGCPLVDITPVLEQAYFQGARIHNSSWGDRENIPPYNTYTATCIDMDEMVWRNPDFLPVVAAGNSGPVYETVSSPSVAKNVLSVGGTNSPLFESIVSFSSTGWAADGRYKPDVVAPASTWTSMWGNGLEDLHCMVRRAAGTSMASPMACGSAALVRQYFEEGWYPKGRREATDGFNPSAALVKAVLIHGASSMANESGYPPGRRQGWGRINLENSLSFEGDEKNLVVFDEWNYFNESHSEAFELSVYPTGSSTNRRCRITLVYTDFPGTAGVTPNLVNDLDLELELAGGQKYCGNDLDYTTGYSRACEVHDSINNVEVISLPVLNQIGVIRVNPRQILQNGQGFALVISGALKSPVDHSNGWMLR